jgi:hypothetical protein
MLRDGRHGRWIPLERLAISGRRGPPTTGGDGHDFNVRASADSSSLVAVNKCHSSNRPTRAFNTVSSSQDGVRTEEHAMAHASENVLAAGQR